MTAEDAPGGIVINGRTIFLLFFILIHLAIASQVNWLAKDIAYGDGSCENLTIPLRYPPMRVPAQPITEKHNATNRLCADFAQIYFPSQHRDVVGSAYSSATTLDPWLRESKYPPLVHFIFSRTLCYLPYGLASLAHLFIQYVLFLVSFVYVSIKLDLKKYLLSMILLLNTCLFLTPVGLSWMERGQFSLYVALCYLWLMLAVITGKKRYAIVAAIFGFVKWTSFPFAFVTSVVYLATWRSRGEFWRRVPVTVIFCSTLAVLFLVFYEEGVFFLKAIFVQEATYEPMGITLARFMSKSVVKVLPLLLVAVGLMERFSVKRDVAYLLPFFAGSAVLLVTYPTFAYDYSVPCLTAFIPCMIYWAHLPRGGRKLVNVAQVGFFTFLLLASWSVYILFNSEKAVVVVYVLAAGCLTALPFLGDMSRNIELPGG